MNVVSAGSYSVASLPWQSRPNAWMLTVVAKATFELVPVKCPLAENPEPR